MTQVSEQRREQIVSSARRIVDEQGPGHLTAEAITHEVGVSRPLLYHYFANMGDLLDAVMAAYLAEFEECLCTWEEAWDETSALADRAQWSVSLVGVLRTALVDGCPLLRGAAEQPQTVPAAYPVFLSRCADIAARRAVEGGIGAYAPCRGAAARVCETMRFAFHGLAEALQGFPELPDDAAAQMFVALWGPGSAPACCADHASAPAPDAPAEPRAERPFPPADQQPERPATAKKGLLGRIFNTGN